ncbi:hypothetical protein ACQ86E_30860 [Bradyrhizobium betae]|uniref:hypothetical protein n=1 Tax=Bradyrhizobium betae TaxID=244734 RepID=UPI003D676775
MNKYCRICWNTNNWRAPTGEAAKLEKGGAFVAESGYGVEEWLFNFAWLQPGPNGLVGKFRYGFLQPINKYRNKYVGKSFDVFLYTVTPQGGRMAIGIIKEVYVPADDELAAALAYMRKRGWLDEMRRDLSEIGASFSNLGTFPNDIINIRFKQVDVELFEPRFMLAKTNVTSRSHRYQPLDWTGPPQREVPSQLGTHSKRDGKRRSEQDRIRAASEGTVYSPQHVKLQNALFNHLTERFGNNAVSYEQEYIDLQLRRGKTLILFEIKIAPKAKSCIRQAIGQLLEYDLYPDRARNSRLVVVGEWSATPSDEVYLGHLQKRFGIPISYRRWNWEESKLDGDL